MKPIHASKTSLLLTLSLAAGSLLASPPPPRHGGPPQRPPERPTHNHRAPLPDVAENLPGAPLPGLSPRQLQDFATGREEFENEETPEGGLGPIFNNVSCVSCHSSGGTGGGSEIVVTRFGRSSRNRFESLETLGGSLLQDFAIAPEAQEVVPPEANIIARRQSTPLFGLGLVEAIPDQAIRALASRPAPDGVTGRVSEVTDVVSGRVRVGKFGWKAQQATLLAFSGDAYLNEMGVTSRFFPVENAPNGNTALLAKLDTVADPEDQPDPETGKGDIDAAADFMRYLGAPPRLPPNASSRAGEGLFHAVGCAVCHTPVWQTGSSPVRALERKSVHLYSDLLLHDMGALGDGIAQGTAAPREMKTAPLWGLRFSGPWLHDGRADTVDEAIRAHDGEGARSRVRYEHLTPTQARQLLDYLNTL